MGLTHDHCPFPRQGSLRKKGEDFEVGAGKSRMVRGPVGDWWLVVVGGGWGAFAHSAHSARTVGEHYIGKLGIFATIGNILASMDDTTPPQCCTTWHRGMPAVSAGFVLVLT